MIDFTEGYGVGFYATLFDPVLWIEYGRFGITGGSINRTNTDLRQSASLSLIDYDETIERWIRVYAFAEQLGEQTRVPLFTGIATSPSISYKGSVATYNLQCYSVLKPIQDIFLEPGWYVDKSANGLNTIRDLLAPIGAPVETNGDSAAIEDVIVAEGNETNLSMIEKILEAIDWIMQIEGDGTIVLSPHYTEPVTMLSGSINNVVETSFSKDRDWFDCPNCLRVIYGDSSAVAKDEDPESMLSIQNRGREVWSVEENPALAEDELLSEYAHRRLGELQELSETASYTRRYLPGVNVDDVIRLGYSDLNGDFTITSQSITLGKNITTSETVKRSM